MQYGLAQPSSCWIYAAVSVWTTKLTRLNSKKPEAIMYFRRVACSAWYSGLLLRIKDRLSRCDSIGRLSEVPIVALELDRRPRRSSLSNGDWDRPSVGRCRGGRASGISSSTWESRTGSVSLSPALLSSPESKGCELSEATAQQFAFYNTS